jgi:hypothetical protein
MDDVLATPTPTPAPAPRSFWVIAAISLLWNAFGCYDYVMSKLDPVGYFKAMGLSPESVAYMESLPSWLTAFWALGVWGSLAGSVLLLMRSCHAVTAFVASLVGLAVSQVYQWTTIMPAEMRTSGMWIMTAVIWGALLFFIWYSRRMQGAGVLR